MAFLHTPIPAPPSELLNDQQALAKWSELPEIAEQLKRVRTIQFSAQSDGTWSAENIPPGEYAVMVNALGQLSGKKTMELWSGQKANVIIPNDSATGTLDLGEIELQAAPQQVPK